MLYQENALDIAAAGGYMEHIGAYRDYNNIPRDSQKNIKKNEVKPSRSQEWCIPPEEDPEFVAAMEDILDAHPRKYDENVEFISFL